MKREQRPQTVILTLLLWFGYLVINYFFFSLPFDTGASMVLALRVVLIHAILFYANYSLLLPYLLEKNKYGLYFLSLAGLVLFTFLLFIWTNELIFIRDMMQADHHRHFRGGPPMDRAFRNHMFVNNIVGSLAVLFVSSTYWTIRRNQQRQQREVSLMNENLQTEMKFLKAQINPHFLLNAMNNIYSMATGHQEKTADMIMKLSEMMKYVLYETNARQVPLGREIRYIKDFIAFQHIKYEEEPDIRVELSNIDETKKISPMILIPFIENAFKHSRLDDGHGYVDIKIYTAGDELQMQVANTLAKSESRDKTGGIGLENVKKRLEYLYPRHNQLVIQQTEGTFTVDLTLTLK